MFGTTRGMLVPAGKVLLAFTIALAFGAPLAASADDGMVDVRTLPRLEGAVEDTARTEAHSLRYGVPTPVAITSAATRKLLAANGWMPYLRPTDEACGSLLFKKGPQGLDVSFTQGLGRPDQSVVYYTATRLGANVPFPDDATDILFDDRRPYLNCFTAAPVEASLDFFRKALAASGWLPLSAADAAADWPNANFDDKIANGARAYFSYANRDGGYRQPPIMLSLRHRDDGRTSVEIRVAPFALPQNLEVARESSGLPVPDHTPSSGSSGDSDSPRRTLQAVSVADIPVVLAFYRRELAARGWKEEANGAVVTPDEVTLNFSSPDQTATLRLSRKYDLTILNLATQMTQAALAARAKAKKDADDKFTSDADAMVKKVMAEDEVRRAAQAAGLSDAPLHALADEATPVPLPDTAENVEFNGPDGKLEFDSSSSVKAIAAFYRGVLKPLGWKEQPSVINKSNMVVMEFAKGGKALSFTVMQLGPKVNVSADGSGLVMANARPAATKDQGSAGATAEAAAEPLEAEPDSALPVPKQHSMSSIGSSKIPGHRYRVSPRAQRQRSRRPQLRAGVLSQRTRQTRVEGDGRARRREAGSGPAGVCLSRRAGDAETRPQQWRDQHRTGAEDSGRGRKGRRHAEARPGQADVQQSRQWRGHRHHQQADHQDRARRGRPIQGPDAGAAARQIPIFAEGRRRPRAEQRDRGRRRRRLGADGGARRRGHAAARLLTREAAGRPRPAERAVFGEPKARRIALLRGPEIGLPAP